MVLHRLLGDREGVRHFLVRSTLRDAVKDLPFAGRKRREDLRRTGAVHGKLPKLGKDLRCERRPREHLLVDDELAGANATDRVDELSRIAILVEVRRGTGSDRVEERLLPVVRREDDDADLWKLTSDARCGLIPRDRAEVGVDDRDVGFGLDRLRDRLLAVVDRGDDLDVGLRVKDLTEAESVRRLEASRTRTTERRSAFAVLASVTGGGPDKECEHDRCSSFRRCADVERSTAELRAFSHRYESERTRIARGSHDVEADTVIGALERPSRGGPLPDETDLGGACVLMNILERLLDDAIGGELLHRHERRVGGVEVTGDGQAVARLVLAGLVAQRFGQAKGRELGWPEVVDHRAD